MAHFSLSSPSLSSPSSLRMKRSCGARRPKLSHRCPAAGLNFLLVVFCVTRPSQNSVCTCRGVEHSATPEQQW